MTHPNASWLPQALADGTYSDFRLDIQGESLKVHRVVLHHQSNSFASHFAKFPKLDHLDLTVTGQSPMALKAMVQFFYTGDYETYWDRGSDPLWFHIHMFRLGGVFLAEGLREHAQKKLTAYLHMVYVDITDLVRLANVLAAYHTTTKAWTAIRMRTVEAIRKVSGGKPLEPSAQWHEDWYQGQLALQKK